MKTAPILAALSVVSLGLATSSKAEERTGLVRYVSDAQGRITVEAVPLDDSATLTDVPASVGNHVENAGYGNDAGTGLLRAWRFQEEVASSLNSATWATRDHGGSPASGSAFVQSGILWNSNGYKKAGLWQCFPYAAPGNISVSGWVYIPSGQPYDDGVSHNVDAMIHFAAYSDRDCTTPASVTGATGLGYIVFAPTTDAWKPIAWTLTSSQLAAGMQSFAIGTSIDRRTTNAAPNYAHFDDVSVTTTAPWRPMKGDLDRDGETDLLLRNSATGDNYAWFMKDENRDAGPTVITPSPASSAWEIAAVDNFGAPGSSRDDLVMWNSASGATELWLMNGATREGPAIPLAGLSPPWKPSASADVNGDGSADLFWRNYSTQKIELWTNYSGSSVVVPSPDQAVNSNWEIVGAPDINKDGQTDLLWYNATSGKIVYWTMAYSAVPATCSVQGLTTPCYYRLTGNFTTPANAGANNWKVLATGDYGIGPSLNAAAISNSTDLVWRNATSGRMVVWFMDNTGARTAGVFVTPDPPAPATDWTIAGPR